MRLDKCDAYTAKETLGSRRRKTYVSATKRKENQRGSRGETNPQSNNQNSLMRREKPVEEQNSK